MAMSPPVNKYTGSYTEDADGGGVRLNAFGHEDADIAFDPLSANRRFSSTADLAVLGTLVFAGPTRESIDVMVPDCIVPPASGMVRIDLRHHVSLSLGLAVPDLCIASTNLLSLIDPLTLDRLSRHTVAAICSWPVGDRHHILAVTNRDIRVARQNLAELQLYVDDHAAHIANCVSADDDNIALMSAELLPRLEGGIRAALDEVDTL